MEPIHPDSDSQFAPTDGQVSRSHGTPPRMPGTDRFGISKRLVQGLRAFARELVQTVLPAVLLALLLNHFVAQGTYVSGQSMEPNLHSEQRLIIEKVSYKLRDPQRGEIVVVDVPHSEIPLIKRVIGLGGESVEIRQNHLFVDGGLIEEPYITAPYQRDFGPVVVPEKHIFVMGDNRNGSNDSRSFGPVPIDHIEGRAWVSYWPPEVIGLLN